MMRTVRSIRRAWLSLGLVLGYAGLLAGCGSGGSGAQALEPSPDVMTKTEVMLKNMAQEKSQYYAQKRAMMKSANRAARKTGPR